MSSHGLHSADASERHAYSAPVICGLHQACLEAAPVALCHALQFLICAWQHDRLCRLRNIQSDPRL